MVKVIQVGFSRTATMSFKAALEILASENGEGIVLHGGGIYRTRDWFSLWMDILHCEKKLDREVAHQLLGKGNNIYSVTDSPFCAYWKELHRAFPDAKVVLLKHPGSCEAHIRSSKLFFSAFRTLVWQLGINFFRPLSMYIYYSFVWHAVKQDVKWETFLVFVNQYSEAEMHKSLRCTSTNDVRTFLALKKEDTDSIFEDSRRTIPKDQLLEFSVADGWDPLCNFLGVPVPDIEFPRRDRHGSAGIRIFHTLLWVGMLISIIVILSDIYVVVTVLLGYTACKWPVLILSIAILNAMWLKSIYVQ